jgi:putative ATP-dependent endonuclease of OLD family
VPIDAQGQRVTTFEDSWRSRLGGQEIFQTESQTKEYVAFRAEYSFGREDTPLPTTYKLITDWQSVILGDEFNRITQIRSLLPMYLIDAQRDLQEDTKLRTSFFGKLVTQLEKSYKPDKLADLEELIEELNGKAVADSDVLAHLKAKLSELNRTTQTSGAGVSINPFPKKIRDLHKGMKVDFQDNGSDSFGMEYHGMGTRSWASILTLGAYLDWEIQQIARLEEAGEEFQPISPLIGLEEPEAHLHLNAQRTLYSQLKTFAGQKIISTHSPYIAGQADLTELRHFYKAEDRAIISFLDVDTMTSEEKRKISHEVIQTQGELLFARAIVLFEGETEKQSFPIFAEKYWGTQAFNLGVTFVAVNGNNYKPFILLAKKFNIAWFVFSDYDKNNVRKGVDNALRDVGYSSPETTIFDNVFKLGVCIENYLISESYQNELKTSINNYYLLGTSESTSEQQILAGQARVNGFNDTALLQDISSDNGKVRYPQHWASEIVKRTDIKCIPPKIRELFEKISEKLNLNPS